MVLKHFAQQLILGMGKDELLENDEKCQLQLSATEKYFGLQKLDESIIKFRHPIELQRKI